jgi:hypothetical protein
LRWLMFNIQQVRQGLGEAGLKPDDRLPDSESVVDACGLIRNWE